MSKSLKRRNVTIKVQLIKVVTGMAKLYRDQILSDYKWLVVYTRYNYEKKVEASLAEKNIEVYLPKKKVLRSWSDRKKWIEEPLFRPYLFVHINSKEYFEVLQTNAVINYIQFEGRPATISDNQIESLKMVVDSKIEFELTSGSFEQGDDVQIVDGPLKGYSGKIIHHMNRNKLLLRVEQIDYSLLVEIGNNYIRQSI